eukprot:RCo054112
MPGSPCASEGLSSAATASSSSSSSTSSACRLLWRLLQPARVGPVLLARDDVHVHPGGTWPPVDSFEGVLLVFRERPRPSCSSPRPKDEGEPSAVDGPPLWMCWVPYPVLEQVNPGLLTHGARLVLEANRRKALRDGLGHFWCPDVVSSATSD